MATAIRMTNASFTAYTETINGNLELVVSATVAGVVYTQTVALPNGPFIICLNPALKNIVAIPVTIPAGFNLVAVCSGVG